MRSRCGAWAVLLLGLVVAASCLALTRASAQVVTPGGRASLIPTATVATLPASPTTGTIRYVTDGVSASDCTIGGASTKVTCIFDGTDWVAVGGVAAEVDTLLSVTGRGFTTSPTSETVQLRILGTGAQALYGAYAFQHSDGSFHFDCFTSSGLNKCDYYRQLDAGFEAGWKNSAGVKKFTFTESTGALTNITLDAEATGNTITLPFKHNIKPVGCSGTTGTLLLDTNATLAPTATCVAGSTNTTLMQAYADFPDSDGEYQFQDKFRLPADWSGAIDLQLFWKAAATSGDVVWQVATLCRADAEIEDAAWNTAQAFAADTAKGTTLQLNTVSLTTLTTTGCAAGEMFYFKIFRQRTHASDTITGVVSLSHGELTIRRAM